MLEQLFIFLAGFTIGMAISGFVWVFKHRLVGTITVDRSLPEDPPHLFLELEDRSTIFNAADKQTVSFRVKHKNYMPQKNLM